MSHQRSRTRPRSAFAFVAVAAALVLGACTSTTSGQGSAPSTGQRPTDFPTGSGSPAPTSTGHTSQAGGTLVFGESNEYPENLLPIILAGNSLAVANLEARLLDGPFRTTPNVTYEADPDQVVGEPKATITGGKQIVTYHLNPKAVWDDGKPITGADYVFTWQAQRSYDPSQGGCAALISPAGYGQIDSVQAPDDQTVVVKFKPGQSYADWRGLFSPLLSKHVFDKGTPAATCHYITQGWSTSTGIPAGATNGPWVLTKANINTTGRTMTLIPNPRYWGSKPKLDKLVDKFLAPDTAALVSALQNGEIDMIYPQPELDLETGLQKLSGVSTEVNAGLNYEHLDFNTKDPLLAHKQVRQAIAYAIDRKALAAATVGKYDDEIGPQGNRLVMPIQDGYVDNGAEYNTQNIAKAKALLQSAGAKMGSDGIFSLDGHKLSFKIMTTQDNPLRDQTIATIANQVKAAGIQIAEFANPDIFAGKDKPTSLEARNFQIALYAWVGGPQLASEEQQYASDGFGNYSQGTDAQADSYLRKMATALDTADAVSNANAADKQLWTDLYTLPLYSKPTLLAYSSKFQGIDDNATAAGPLWNSDTFTRTS